MLAQRPGGLRGAMSADKDREPIAAVLSQASAPAGAVFLSYASEDAPAALRSADALQAIGASSCCA